MRTKRKKMNQPRTKMTIIQDKNKNENGMENVNENYNRNDT